MEREEYEGMPHSVEIWLNSKEKCIALWKIIGYAECYTHGWKDMRGDIQEVIDLIKWELHNKSPRT